MNNVSYKVALGGVISSLCIFAMFLTGIMPFLYLTLPMIAGALMTIIVTEVNIPWAFLTYASVSILSLFITFDKGAALIFILLFGHYPIIRYKLEKIHIRPLKNLVKLCIFNICAVVYYELICWALMILPMIFPFSESLEYTYSGRCQICSFASMIML